MFYTSVFYIDLRIHITCHFVLMSPRVLSLKRLGGLKLVVVYINGCKQDARSNTTFITRQAMYV